MRFKILNFFLIILSMTILDCSRNTLKNPSNSYQIKGFVSDLETHEALPFASISFSGELNTIEVMTQIDGYYIIKNIEPGYYTIKIQYIGYKEVEDDSVKIELEESIFNFELVVDSLSLNQDVFYGK